MDSTVLEGGLCLKRNHMHILVGAGRAQGLVKPPAEPQRPPFPAPPSGATSLTPYVGACSVASVVSDSVRPHGLQPARLLCPWDSPGKNPGVGCHALLQGIYLTQESNPCLLLLLQWQVGSLALVPPGIPFNSSRSLENLSLIQEGPGESASSGLNPPVKDPFLTQNLDLSCPI